MGEKEDKKQSLGHEVGLGITLIRGLLLVVLGLSLLFIPDKTSNMLFNMMGMFWLMLGIVTIRREAHARGNRLLMAAAICGVVAGLLVLTRNLSRNVLPEVWVKNLLGAVILLTGVLHATAQSRYGRQIILGRPLVNVLLGLAEIVLGALLILAPTTRETIIYNVALIWALVSGGLLLFTAVRQFLSDRRQQPPDRAAEQSGVQAEEDEEKPGELPEQQSGEQAEQTDEQAGEQA